MRSIASILFLFLLAAGSLSAQEFCRDILKEAQSAYESDSLDLALARLKAVETCDYKNHLIGERQEVQDSIFARIIRQQITAEKNEQKAIQALIVAEKARREAEEARDSANAAKALALKSKAEAIAQQKIADSARIAAERATREALVNDLAFKAQNASGRSTSFRLLEMAFRIDSTDSQIQKLIDENYHSNEGFYAFRFTGHRAPVRYSAFSEDGEKLISASPQKILIWDIPGQKLLHQITAQELGNETIATFAPATQLFAGTRGNQVTIWNLATLEKEYSLPNHSDKITALAFSADGKKLAYGGADGVIKIWDIRNKEEALGLAGHSSNVISLAFSPDGSQLVSGSLEDMIIWNLKEGSKAGTLSGHTQFINALAFSPDGARIASASADNSIKIWDAKSQKLLLTLLGHTDEVSDIRYSPDGARLISASNDKTAKLWDAAYGKELFTLRGHRGELGAAVFSPDGSKAATCSWDQEIIVWDLTAQPDEFAIAWFPKKIKAISLSAGHTKVLGATAKTITVWDMDNRSTWRHFQVEERSRPGRLLNTSSNVHASAISPDGKKAATASNLIRIWDLTAQKELFALTGHRRAINSVSFFAGGARLVSASDDGTVKLWDVATQRELASFSGPSGHVARFARMSQDGSRMIALFEVDENSANAGNFSVSGPGAFPLSGQVSVWEVQDNKLIFNSKEMELGNVTLTSAALSPDGYKIAIGLFNEGVNTRAIKIWDISRAKPRLAFHNPNYHGGFDYDKITTIAFSPDGKNMVSGGSGGDILMSEVRDDEGHFSFKSPGGPGAKELFFSTDGKKAVAWFEDGLIRVWDIKEVLNNRSKGTPFRLPPHRSKVVVAALSPNGAFLASASKSKELRLWNTANGSLDTIFDRLSKEVEHIAFSSDNKNMAVLVNGEAKVWRLDNKKEVFTASGSNFVGFSPDGTQLISAAEATELKAWNLNSPGDPRIFSGHRGPINFAAYSPDGAWIASASRDSTVRLWPQANGQLHPTALEFPNEVEQVAFSPDGKTLAVLAGDSIRAWTMDSLRELFSVPGTRFVRFSPDGTKIVSGFEGSENSKIIVRDAQNGLPSWSTIEDPVNAFFYPQGGPGQLFVITADSAKTYFLNTKSLIAAAERKYQINELLPQQIEAYKLENGFLYAGILDAQGMPTPLIEQGKRIKMERYRDYFAEQSSAANEDAGKERYRKISTAIDEALKRLNPGRR
ncbi:MAG: WD40 repeat domain-containing protein [Phaeodactylibacter sp.]|nr:WD40 repeat domain-containing protein [Phaeodactylibacter sp.]